MRLWSWLAFISSVCVGQLNVVMASGAVSPSEQSSVQKTSIQQDALKNANNTQWIRYAQVSPNGKTIAFSAYGDIYIVGVEGGIAQPLTVTDSYEFHPIWSEDSQTLAFASDRTGNFDIYVMAVNGGGAKRLTFHSADDIPTDFIRNGKAVLFNSARLDNPESAQYPSTRFPELYQVSVDGGMPKQLLTVPALEARMDNTGQRMLYVDKKSAENPWRKHQRSAATRDIWLKTSETQQQLTQFDGSDITPLWDVDQQGMLYLSESSGSFNVWRKTFNDSAPQQVTFHKTHPVRFLSQDNAGNLVYTWHGQLFRLAKGEKSPKAIDVQFRSDRGNSKSQPGVHHVTEYVPSPNGREVAFIMRGDVYVTSLDYPTIKRITDTPEEEQGLSFSPDGKTLVYASERQGSWNIYQVTKQQTSEAFFFSSTVLQEKAVLDTKDDLMQPAFSPDGKYLALLSNRNEVKLYNLQTKKLRTLLAPHYSYSYEDGDMWFQWSPDSQWLAYHYDDARWMKEVGLIKADGKQPPINLSLSGYADTDPMWAMHGNAVIWLTAKYGRRNHGSWGADMDMMGVFLNQKTLNAFAKSDEDRELALQESEAEEENEKSAEQQKGKNNEEEPQLERIHVEREGLDTRIRRLTLHSSELAGGYLTNDGSKLYYLSRFEDGFDLWVHEFENESTYKFIDLNAHNVVFTVLPNEEQAIGLLDGQLVQIDLINGRPTPIDTVVDITTKPDAEYQYLLEHIWRLMKTKFYRKDMHGVDWDFYYQAYQSKLVSINNGHDFSELVSEMLGELNASHTGSSYHSPQRGEQTGSLGVYWAWDDSAQGLRITDVLPNNPFVLADQPIQVGDLIVAINGRTLTADQNPYALLNQQVGKRVLIEWRPKANDKKYNRRTKPLPKTRQRVIRPMTLGDEEYLAYQRWVQRQREQVEKHSSGQIGYIHIQRMNDASFRDTYAEILGRQQSRKAMVIDTRYNLGGWLHDDLAMLFSGQRYLEFVPRGRVVGSDAHRRWQKPSIVVMNEANYSDAHIFPYVYKELGLGQLVGRPVPGTGTAVWWKTLYTEDIIFGIPQVGVRGIDGQLLENQELRPDFPMANDPDQLVKGVDQQLLKAVDVLLKSTKQ
ncbi:S41 family peptidase [Zooshikella sp. RANM57]|uniref:S41 family peptidase n=1 Tax=Zooshikella sp. RANM57 TaxID=3425863 RepID=UPI003D6E0011